MVVYLLIVVSIVLFRVRVLCLFLLSAVEPTHYALFISIVHYKFLFKFFILEQWIQIGKWHIRIILLEATTYNNILGRTQVKFIKYNFTLSFRKDAGLEKKDWWYTNHYLLSDPQIDFGGIHSIQKTNEEDSKKWRRCPGWGRVEDKAWPEYQKYRRAEGFSLGPPI